MRVASASNRENPEHVKGDFTHDTADYSLAEPDIEHLMHLCAQGRRSRRLP